MNTPNPLIPQGTTPAGGKSTVRNAVLTIVVVHVAFIGSLLFWGCSKDTSAAKKDDSTMSSITSTDTPVYAVDTNTATTAAGNPATLASNPSVPNGSVATPAPASNAASPIPSVTSSLASSPTSGAPISPIATVPPSVSSLTPTAPSVTGSAQEYTVQKGDLVATIAKKHGISSKALLEANPGLDPKKLKLNQKIQIPAPVEKAAASTATGSATADAAAPATEGNSYTVKPGDNLVRIAKNHHTTVKAIVALNGLKSQNSLKVGQKLKMPAAKAATAAAPDTATSASAAGASPAVTPLSSAAHPTTGVN